MVRFMDNEDDPNKINIGLDEEFQVTDSDFTNANNTEISVTTIKELLEKIDFLTNMLNLRDE